jgi:hypothetical protein
VAPAPDRVGEFAERGKIRRFVKCDAVCKRKAFSGERPFRDVIQSWVV